jgi:hypothetical protein
MDASSPTQRHLPSGSEARDARALGLDPRGPPGRRRGGARIALAKLKARIRKNSVWAAANQIMPGKA